MISNLEQMGIPMKTTMGIMGIPTWKKYQMSDKQMNLYNLSLNGNKLTVGFGSEKGDNSAIVREVETKLEKMKFPGGSVLLVNGPASLPVAMLIAHKVGHLYQAVACWDPKLAKYVVAIAHGDDYSVGDVLDGN